MKTSSIEQLAEIQFNVRTKGTYALPWANQSDAYKAASAKGMEAALAAHYASLGEGMPHIDHYIAAYEDTADTLHNDPKKVQAIEAVRNLMLTACARKTRLWQIAAGEREKALETKLAILEKQAVYDNEAIIRMQSAGYELEVAKAQLAAIAMLPEKWRNDQESAQSLITVRGCAYEVEKALGTPPAVEPVPAIIYRHERTNDASTLHQFLGGVASCAVDVYDDGSIAVVVRGVDGVESVFGNKKAWEEPLPADPLAEVKAAHARGEKIQKQDRILGGQWHDDPDPNWHPGWNWRVVPVQPAPSGKLSDEQLGEIGAKAAAGKLHVQMNTFCMVVSERSAFWDGDKDARAAFAAAVAAEVRKEYEKTMASLSEIVVNEQTQKHQALADVANLRAENAKQAERLAALEWRPVSVKPTREDADKHGFVEVLWLGDDQTNCIDLYAVSMWPWGNDNVTHWRTVSPPPAPTAAETERAEFEQAAMVKNLNVDRYPDGGYMIPAVTMMWEGWQARAAKEVQP